MVSLGGAMGGAFAALVGPKIFPAFWEYLRVVGFGPIRVAGSRTRQVLMAILQSTRVAGSGRLRRPAAWLHRARSAPPEREHIVSSCSGADRSLCPNEVG